MCESERVKSNEFRESANQPAFSPGFFGIDTLVPLGAFVQRLNCHQEYGMTLTGDFDVNGGDNSGNGGIKLTQCR